MIARKPKLLRWAAAAVLPLAAADLPAQDTIPAPKFPITLRAPENASWSWTRKGAGEKDSAAESIGEGVQGSGAEKKPPMVRALSVTKTGPIYFVRATVQNGRSWEQWFFRRAGEKPYQAIQFSGASNWERLTSAHVGTDACQFESSDFEDFDWINEKNYVGVRTVDGVSAHCFEMSTEKPLTRREAVNYNYAAASAAHDKGETYNLRTVRAYLDPKTLLPLRFESGKDIFVYAMGAAPAGKQVPPEAVVADFRKFLAEAQLRKR